MSLPYFDLYVSNFVNVWIAMSLFYTILMIHVNLYYTILLLLFIFLINNKPKNLTESTLSNFDQVVYSLNITWVATTAITSIGISQEALFSHDPALLSKINLLIPIAMSIVAYLLNSQKQSGRSKKATKIDSFQFKGVLTYLILLGIYAILMNIDMKRLRFLKVNVNDNIFFLNSTGIFILSLINFATINLYERDLVSQRFIYELIHGLSVYILKFVFMKNNFNEQLYFALYLICSIIYRETSYYDQWVDSKMPGSIAKMNVLLAKMFYANNYELINVLRDYVSEYTKGTGVCQSISGLRRIVIVTDRELITHVLANPSIYEQGSPVRNATCIVGDNAFPKFVGKQYHKHKQYFMPGKLAELAQKHLSNDVVKCVDNLVNKWKEQDGQIYIDEKILWPNLHRLMFDIFGLTMIGYDYGSISGACANERIDDMTKVRPAALYYLNMLVKAAQTQCPFKLYMFYQRHFNRQYAQARQTMQTHCHKIVKEYFDNREFFEKKEVHPVFYEIVQNMLKNKEEDRLTNQELVDDISDLLAAGTDSISTVLSWAVFYLSKESEIQNRIRQELVEHKLYDKQKFTYEELERCIYLRRFVKELLRHAPINVPIQRTAVQFDKLKEFNIYPDDELMLMARDVSQNDLYWKNSKKFDPDREEWMDEKNDNIKHLFTFGGGARACPGRNFSQLQLRTIIALLLMRVEFIDTPGNLGGETSMLEGVVKPKTVHIKINFLA